MIRHSVWLAILLIWLPWLLVAQPSTRQPALGGCAIFPANNIWNRRIESLPIHERSDDYVAAIGLDKPVHPDFGAGLWNGGPIGIPFIVVPADQPTIPIEYTAYGDESDAGPYPVPLNAPVEGGSESDGDRHVLVLQEGSCRLYELYRAFPAGDH